MLAPRPRATRGAPDGGALAQTEDEDTTPARRGRGTSAPARRRGREVDNRVQRDDILQVAAEEFGARGYQGTNLRHVADRLGVTRQALYHYFSRKHDILVALFLNHFDALEANLLQAAEGVGPDQRFRAMMRAHLEFMARHPSISQVFGREEGQLPKRAATIVRKRRRAVHALFVDAYDDGVKAGVLRETDAKLVISLMLGVSSWLHRWYHADGRLDPAELSVFAEDLLYLGTRAAERDGANGAASEGTRALKSKSRG